MNPIFMSQADNLLMNTIPSADSESSVYPAANLVSLPVSKPYRSDGATDTTILFDFAQPQTIGMVAIVAHNLTATASITWRGGSLSNPDGSEYEVSVPWLSPTCWAKSPALFRYWSLIISDSGNPDGFIEIGYVMAGSYTEFPMVFQPEWEVDWNHVNQYAENEIGVPMVGLNLSTFRTLRMEWDGLSTAESVIIRDYFRGLKMNLYPSLVVTNQEAGTVLFGRLIKPITLRYPNGHVGVTGVEFREDPVLRVISGVSVTSPSVGTPWDTAQWDTTQWGA